MNVLFLIFSNTFYFSASEMKNSLDVELQEMIENRESTQESIGEDDKDEVMDV